MIRDKLKRVAYLCLSTYYRDVHLNIKQCSEKHIYTTGYYNVLNSLCYSTIFNSQRTLLSLKSSEKYR